MSGGKNVVPLADRMAHQSSSEDPQAASREDADPIGAPGGAAGGVSGFACG